MEKKKRSGRKNLPPEEHRFHKVEVRMSSSELVRLDQIRGTIPRAKFLRQAGFRKAEAGIDRVTFSALARVGNNINQIAKSINTDGSLEAHMLLEKLNELGGLIGKMRK